LAEANFKGEINTGYVGAYYKGLEFATLDLLQNLYFETEEEKIIIKIIQDFLMGTEKKTIKKYVLPDFR
jgi:hypothetical protein